MTAVLIVDDHERTLKFLEANLSSRGYQVYTAMGAKDAVRLVTQISVDVALVDLMFKGNPVGLEILSALTEISKNTAIVMMTARGTIPTAVEAMRRGAHTYIQKQDLKNLASVCSVIEKALQEHQARRSDHYQGEVFDTVEPAPPRVSVSLLTRIVPTAYCHLLDASTFPLVNVVLDGTTQECATATLRIGATIAGYSDTAVASLSVPQQKQVQCQLLPLLTPEAVARLNEIRPATLRITVEQLAPTSRVLYDQTERIRLHARNTALLAVKAPDGSIVDLTNHLAAWVTPRCPEIERLLRRAVEYHPERRLVGYQGASTLACGREIVRSQARAIFTVLKRSAKLVYVNSPLSLGQQAGQVAQRIRLPTESLAAGSSANCIDGAVLFASLLELAAIDPLIVIVPGHAFVGWRVWHGAEQCEFLETTLIGYSRFDRAQEIAERQYENALQGGHFAHGLFDPAGFARLIDIANCRAKGIYPPG